MKTHLSLSVGLALAFAIVSTTGGGAFGASGGPAPTGPELTSYAVAPGGYWDTNAFDAPEERVYTVGSQNTATVTANTSYQVYFRMSNGNFASDTAKIVWQRGHYTLGCLAGPAWCIFSDESKIQYAWNIAVPGVWQP